MSHSFFVAAAALVLLGASVAAAGTLSDVSYGAVATCAAEAASCSTSALVFTLGARPTVKRSGNHTLSAPRKFESIGI